MKKLPSDPNEEPFPVNDSTDRLWDLLGNARNTEAAPNFVQNVVREARLNADQTQGSGITAWFAGLVEKLQRPAFGLTATATAAVAIGLVVFVSQSGNDDKNGLAGTDAGTAPITVPTPAPVPAPAAPTKNAAPSFYTPADQLDDIDYLGELVAVTDPAQLNDQMLADLLY
jgi:hypothetical protein